MYAKRKTVEEQYRLVMECRSSGLTDYQWCEEHGIKPGTFHSWVGRLKKRSEYSIPPHKAREVYSVVPKPDVVKLEISDAVDTDIIPSEEPPIRRDSTIDSHSIEVQSGGITIKISNRAEPELVSCLLSSLGGGIC